MRNGASRTHLRDLRRTVDSPAFKYYRNLQRVRSHLTSHLADSLSLGEAAEIAGYERCYFSAYFRRRVNLGFSEWVSGLRVARAAELIATRDCTLSWVSDQVGFANQRAFQRAFKKWTGMTARDFRADVRRAAGSTGSTGSDRSPAFARSIVRPGRSDA